jgi:cytochrome c-type biogenesis protein CcmH
MKNLRYLLAILITLFVSVLAVQVVVAQQPTPSDDQVNAIAKQLYCPVCENIPLDVCGTAACAQWRELIREKLAAGWTEQQIKYYFVQQYGARVLGTPPVQGINWLVYLVPPIAFGVGVYILYRAYRSWKKPIPSSSIPAEQNAPAQTQDTTQDDYIRRLEEEVHKH